MHGETPSTAGTRMSQSFSIHPSIDAGVKAGVQDALGGSTTTAAAGAAASSTTAKPAGRPTTIEEWEKLWATERAAIVKKITDNKWGKSADGKTLTGPEGFKIGRAHV